MNQSKNQYLHSQGSTNLHPHPTAQAFFDALDAKSLSSQQSAKLQRRSQSLGWRNRYSQNDQYPISMITVSTGNNHRDVAFTVQQIQRGEVEGTYGTGATVWPAAMVLLKYLERNFALINGKRVVDLGSGTGVTSLAAALLGARHVVCTDGEEAVVQLAYNNCFRAATLTAADTANGTTTRKESDPNSTKTTTNDNDDTCNNAIWVGHCPILVQKYWWGVPPLPDNQCDVVLVADCVLPKLYPIAPLVQAIDELLSSDANDSADSIIKNNSKQQRLAILSYEHRYYPEYDPRSKFRELASQRGLTVETIPRELLDPVYSVDDIEIWHVTRNSSL